MKTVKSTGTVYILVRDLMRGGKSIARQVMRVYGDEPEIPPDQVVPAILGGGYYRYSAIAQNVWETFEESEDQ